MDSIKRYFSVGYLKNNRYYTIRKPLACICKNTDALRHKLKETLHHSCVWLRIFSLK
ncbi:flavoprotein oxidoreductase [Helicobacter pylori]|uniref:flavoprotein oxidoreductase n=1 Tax=Helicobacter pylori TaxID=210 RepID=UPI001FD2744B|nr:flavoprotein oxidoreductase [Helicobacter pylori]UOS67423.1 flavoprotein oxidoreductase [Helicobacter pylori]